MPKRKATTRTAKKTSTTPRPKKIVTQKASGVQARKTVAHKTGGTKAGKPVAGKTGGAKAKKTTAIKTGGAKVKNNLVTQTGGEILQKTTAREDHTEEYAEYLERYQLYGEGRPHLGPSEFERLDEEMLDLLALETEQGVLTDEQIVRLQELEFLLLDSDQ